MEQLDLPPWNLRETSLIVLYPTGEGSFLEANPSAVHPFLTPNTWEYGDNSPCQFTNRTSPTRSDAETAVPDTRPAVLLLRTLPRNQRYYVFGRGNRRIKPDVTIPSRGVSHSQFCVYPQPSFRVAWIIQKVSNKVKLTINGYKLSKDGRALRHDYLNKVVIGGDRINPGLTLYIKLVWPKDFKYGYPEYLDWRWQDPLIPELGGLNFNDSVTSVTSTTVMSRESQNISFDGSTEPTFHIWTRKFFNNPKTFYAQHSVTGLMLTAEIFPTEYEAKEQYNWRNGLRVRSISHTI
jgi:hypothetical protein